VGKSSGNRGGDSLKPEETIGEVKGDSTGGQRKKKGHRIKTEKERS